MSSLVNAITLIGRLGKTPELVEKNGRTRTLFSIATTEAWNNKTTSERETRTDWVTIVAYNGTATNICQFFEKGDEIHISGRLHNDRWTPKGQEEEQDFWHVIVDQWRFTESKQAKQQRKARNGAPDISDASAHDAKDDGDANDGEPDGEEQRDPAKEDQAVLTGIDPTEGAPF